MQPWEIIATITGILAVALQAKEKILAWPLGLISVGISVVIFYYAKLYSDLGLHVIYIFMGIYGWIVWSNRDSERPVVSTKIMSKQLILICVMISIIGTFLLGYLMDNYTDADLAYFDAFTTSTSLVANFLLAKKYLQNWIFWIVVDVIAFPMYMYKGLYFFAFLFFIYCLLAVWGYISWKVQLEVETA